MRPDYCPIGNEPCQSLCDTPCSTQQRYTTDAMKVRQAVAQAVLQHEAKDEPVAWRTFDGEGGYDYRTYDMNENYANEWNERNPKHNGWVEPLYTAPPTQPEPVRDTEAHYKAVVKGVQKLFNDKRTQPAPVQETTYVYTCNGCGALYADDDVSCDCQTPPMMQFDKHILVSDTTPPAAPVQEPVAWELGAEVYWGDSPEMSDYVRKEGTPLYTAPPQRTWVGLTDEEMKDALMSVDVETKRLPPGFKAFAIAIETKLKEKNT